MVAPATLVSIGIAALAIIAVIILLALYLTNTPPFAAEAPIPPGAVVY